MTDEDRDLDLPRVAFFLGIGVMFGNYIVVCES